MWLLWLVTIGWAFSFSLIGEFLSGQVDNFISVLIRTGLALLVFLPLLRPAGVPAKTLGALAGIGAIQIGLTYLFLFHAFDYLSVPEILLFTIFTPLYVTLVDECILGRRRLPWLWWAAAGLAVGGAAIIRYGEVSSNPWTGFFLIQCANLSFAAGQVFYKRLKLGTATSQARAFAFFFLGATAISAAAALAFADWTRIPVNTVQWSILLWLGIGASGLGYLGWNLGARMVNTGQLAVMNNMLIPAGILVNVLIWSRDADLLRLAFGGAIILVSVWLAGRSQELRPKPT